MTEIVATFMNDGRFLPLGRFAKVCAEQFIVGDRYVVEVGSQQSAAKRAMFHATLSEAYANLPDEIGAKYLNVEHFRKSLTIQAGFATEVQFPAASKAEAQRLAAALQTTDAYSVVTVKDAVVTQWRARSTSSREMDGKTFSALVDAVLAKASDLLGTDVHEFNRVSKDKPDKQLRSGAPPAAEAKAEASHPPEPDPGSASPGSGQRRKLSYEEAVAMLPMAKIIRTAVVRLDGRVSESDWSFEEVDYDLRHAEIIGLSEKVPGFPLGMRDANGRVVYYQTRRET